MRSARGKILLSVLIVAGVCGVGYFALFHGGEGAETEKVEGGNGRREALLSKLAEERGGLPVDQALKAAKTQKAREFIEKDMAYQRQSRSEAADEARTKLDELVLRLEKATDEKEIVTLQKQVGMLQDLIAKLESQ